MPPSDVALLGLAAAAVALMAGAVAMLRRVERRQEKLQQTFDELRASLDSEFDLLPVHRRAVAAPRDGLPIGAPAPGFSLETVAGDRVSLDDLLADGRAVLLLFLSPTCPTCAGLLPAVRFWQIEHAAAMRVAVVSKARREPTIAEFGRFDVEPLLVDSDSRVSEAYLAEWSPAAVLIRPTGVIGSYLKLGDEAIRVLVRDHLAAFNSAAGLPAAREFPRMSIDVPLLAIGQPLPPVSLIDLAGGRWNPSDVTGRPVLLLFWHPGCRVSQRMTEELRASGARPAAASEPLLFIVSFGEEAATRLAAGPLGLRVLLDPAMDFGRRLGVRRTPSAILADADGRVASSLATGEQEVRALLAALTAPGLPAPAAGR